jgi:hypothetical protein
MWRNRTVCLVGITLVLGTGCIVHQNSESTTTGGGSPPPPVLVTGDSALRVHWELAYLDGTLTHCEDADTPTVTVRATMRSGARFVESFPCEIGVGVAVVPPGLYDVAIDLVDSLGRPVSTLYQTDLRVFDGLVTEPDEVALFPVQTWDLVWTIGVLQRGGRVTPATCRDVGAATVQFSARLDGEAPEIVELPCESYSAVSPAIRPGDYEVRMLLLDRLGRPLADTGIGVVEVTFDETASLDADFTL